NFVFALVVRSARHGDRYERSDLLKAVILGAAWFHDPDAIVGHAFHRAIEIFAIVRDDIEPLNNDCLFVSHITYSLKGSCRVLLLASCGQFARLGTLGLP